MVNTGQNLVLLLRTVGLPEDAYILDERIHPIEESMALKRMADVCLHPSKVEGFGLNVLECQKLGTPVITTKFFAMADFTKYGISVPPRQHLFMQGGLVAMPDVQGVVEALTTVYNHEQKKKRSQEPTDIDFDDGLGLVAKIRAKVWLNEHFSTARVADQFGLMLENINGAPEKRKRRYPDWRHGERCFVEITGDYPPPVNWVTPWTVSRHPDVEINGETVDNFLARQAESTEEYPDAVIIPTLNADGSEVTLMLDETIHPNVTVAIRTHLYAEAQVSSSSRHALVAMIAQRAQLVRRLPEGAWQALP